MIYENSVLSRMTLQTSAASKIVISGFLIYRKSENYYFLSGMGKAFLICLLPLLSTVCRYYLYLNLKTKNPLYVLLSKRVECDPG